MNIRQLEAFQEVVATGSVTRAAARLGVSQPAVSQLIGQLEKSCGFKLFERRASKLVLTREGEALYTEVRRMFIGVNQISRVAMALRDRSWGSVRLGAFPTLARCVLPEIALKFSQANPHTRFHLQSMRSRSLIDEVATQNLDIALSTLAADRPEVENVFIRRVRAVCIIPISHKLAEKKIIHPENLASEPFISLGPQDHSRTIIDRVFDDAGVSLNVRIETGQAEIACSLTAANAGISIVDPICAYNNIKEKIVIRPFVPETCFDIWLLQPQSSRSFGLIDNFTEFMKEELDTRLTSIDSIFWQS